MAEGNKLNETFQQIKQLIVEMPLMKKLSILITIGVSFAVIVFLVQLSRQSNYQVLFSDLHSEDIGAITASLDKLNVPYELQSSTKSVLVPGDKVLDTRLKLAHEGLPQFGGVGFEIFDQQSFGMTDFEQRLNYQRALQGELSRTINELEEIEDSRVHLVLPEKSVFGKTQESPSASIVVRLKRDSKLSEDTVESIVNLVSASVANMESKNVTVVDTSGNLLSSASSDSLGGQTAIRSKRDMENSFETKIRTLLEPIVGFGKVQVKITANIDMTSKQTTEEKYDPESVAVRSESRSKNKESDNTSGDNSNNKNKDMASESVNYEISKQIESTNKPMGELKNLSVAVIVDGKYQKDPANADAPPTYTARTPEELKGLEDIVKSAIGFDEKRGDQFKIVNFAFQNPEDVFASAGPTLASQRASFSFYINLIVNVVILLIAVLLILFVVRPLLALWGSRKAPAGTIALTGMDGVALPAGEMKNQLQTSAQSDPNSMVTVLRNWME